MLQRSNKVSWWGRRGSVTAQVALSLPVLIGVTALGLDAGMLYVQRRQAQTAAEAAVAGRRVHDQERRLTQRRSVGGRGGRHAKRYHGHDVAGHSDLRQVTSRLR